MPKYEINSALNGIEIYFESKPEESVLDELRENGWRWHYKKQCWYNRNSSEAKAFAQRLCDTKPKGEQRGKRTYFSWDSFAQSQTSTVSYNLVAGNQVISKVDITRTGNNYTVRSTNNQLICCDCNRMISIHAPACPFCGCPMSHIVETNFNDMQRQNRFQAQREEEMRRKAEEQARLEAERQRREAEEARRLERQRAREEKKRRELEEYLRKEKEAEIRANKIKEICSQYSVHNDIVKRLISSSISPEALEGRISRILYYKQEYSYLNIELTEFITSDTIDDYVLRNRWREEPTARCTGNCSTCTREHCIEGR